MLSHLLRRLLMAVPTLLGVALVSFALVHMIPGDPVTLLYGTHALSPAEHAAALHRLGLDGPLPRQFATYVWRAAHGDFGTSLVTGEPVIAAFASRLPATLELSAAAMFLALLLGVPAGVVAALRRGRWPDHLTMTASLAGYSMPVFWWGMLLILLFSVGLEWTPVSGRLSAATLIEPRTGLMLVDTLLAHDRDAFADALLHLVLPALTLCTIPLAVIARMTRSAMLGVLGEDYVRTARAKGAAPWRVVVVHALRNALLPVVTVTALQVGTLLAGAVLTETVFSWPGIGQWMVQAVFTRDYPVVQGGVVLIAACVVAVNMSVDLVYAAIDPRIRHAGR